MTVSRFQDNGERVSEFLRKPVLIQCPSCRRCAVAIKGATGEYSFQCRLCGIVSAPAIAISRTERFYGYALWLRTPVRGKSLWAYNREHLEFLDRYVTAALRERLPNHNQSMASRLPDWMTSAKNRAEVMKGIGRLKAKLG